MLTIPVLSKKLRTMFTLLASGEVGYLLFAMQQFIPHWLLRCDCFSIVRFESFPHANLPPLKDSLVISVNPFSTQLFQSIAVQLPIKTRDLLFQIGTASHAIKVISIAKDSQVIAVAFARLTNEIRSRSGYRQQLSNQKVCWVFGVFVKEEYRQDKLFSHLTHAIHHIACAESNGEMMCEIHFRNRASIAAHLKIGYVPTVNIFSIQLFGKQFFVKNTPPKIHPNSNVTQSIETV